MFFESALFQKIAMGLCYSGSLVGFVSGLLAAEHVIDPAQGVQIAIVAVITAITGLFGAVALPAFRLWLEYRDKLRNDLRSVIDRVQRDLDHTSEKVDAVIANQQEHLKKHAEQPPPEKPE